MSTKIEWTDETWNPVTGCSPVSAGCANCYARRMAQRLAGRFGYPADEPFRVTFHPDKLNEPMRWKKPRRIFVCSMGDLFHEELGWSDIEQIFMVMVKARHHTFQVLTKRADRMQEFVSTCFPDLAECSPHIWLGVTAENQAAADERIPTLLRIPAAVRFVSVEPMLGQVDLGFVCLECDTYYHYSEFVYTEGDCPTEDCMGGYNQQFEELNWIIAGGETGPHARQTHPDWFRSVRGQCINAGIPFFFKQWGEYSPRPVYDAPDMFGGRAFNLPSGGRMAAAPGNRRGYKWHDENTVAYKCGRKIAGHLLDGKEWRQWPD